MHELRPDGVAIIFACFVGGFAFQRQLGTFEWFEQAEGVQNRFVIAPAAELFKYRSKLDYSVIPHNGGGASMNSILGGHTDATIESLTLTAPLAESGLIVHVATTGLTRSEFTPDVPTAAESGFPGFKVTGFDIDTKKVTDLEAGRSYIFRIPAEEIQSARKQGFSACSLACAAG